MKLRDIAEIRSGYQFRGKIEPDPAGAYRVIQIKDIKDGQRLSTDDLVTVNINRAPEPYSVDLGDVLFLSRGQRLFATPITERLTDTIATYYFFILRPKTQQVRPRYLAWCINQVPVQAVLNTVKRGTHMPLVSRTDVEGIEVDLPPLATQDTIVKLAELARRESDLLAAIQRKRTELIEAICLNAARRRS